MNSPADKRDLFSDSYAESLIQHGDEYVCKVADATWSILVEKQRIRREKLIRQMQSVERDRSRMDALKVAGMAANPQMTVGDAMAWMAGGDA